MSDSSSNFDFLAIWDQCEEIMSRAQQAEGYIFSDARSACFYARSALELMVKMVFEIDERVEPPKHDKALMSLIHEKSFKQNLKYSLFPKLKLIIQQGNAAAHDKRKIEQREALQAVKELHHVLYWFARTYTPGLDRSTFGPFTFDEAKIPQLVSIDAKVALSTAETIQQLKDDLARKDEEAEKEKAQLLRENAAEKEKNKQLRQQVAEAIAASQQTEDKHDYNEEETRHWLIDPLIKEAGWKLSQVKDREYPVMGMPITTQNPQGNGEVDYVLWSDDGTPLAVVEAKRTSKDPEVGKTQAKLYADCLEQMHGTRPVIFYTNGYETFLWDDCYYPPRPVQGFYTQDELALLIKRRNDRKPFFEDPALPHSANLAAKVDNDITNRHYQKAALTATLEKFELEHERKALLVMATGTGKTRTVISLVDLLTKHNWVKNILFLADRNALLTQAKKNFVKLTNRISCTILDSGLKKGSIDSRLYFSTYPTMKNLLDRAAEQRPFSVGHFDLIIVDEAHRSVYAKYKQIFEYFDGLLVGLTATPKDEIDKNTYGIFDLQDGDPTYAYEDTSAFNEGFLVPPTKITVGTKFVRKGVKYSELSDKDKKQWEEKDPLKERDEVLPSEVNKFLFNKKTAELMFSQLLSRDENGGLHVEGGDVIGKTIIFAANNDHAKFLQEVFDANYPKWAGKLAQVITYKNDYAQSLIDEFSTEDEKGFDPKNPKMRIAISVDMMDTGIDVPEVVNLVFFKVVQSKVKFTQMMGRGTRLCPDLFGPGQDKKTFKVFDFCQNFEFFDQFPKGVESGLAKPLSQQVFEKRILLANGLKTAAAKLEEKGEDANTIQAAQKLSTYNLDLLHHQVSGMNLDNFIVRPKRQFIEPFLKREHWDTIDDSKHIELENHIAHLPTEAEPFTDEETANNLSLQFDNLVLGLQLDALQGKPVSPKKQERIVDLAQKLESKSNVPNIKIHLVLIQRVQTREFWEDISVFDLETLRLAFRNLLFALDKVEKDVVYTDFEDEILEVKEQEGQHVTAPLDLKQYKLKTEAYIKEHQDQLTIQKLKRNKPITQADLDTLENLLIEASGMADTLLYREQVLETKPLGTFIRELVGLDMAAAKEAFSDFLDEGIYTSKQIEFVNQVINYLMQNGILIPEKIFDSPFTRLHHESAIGLFEIEKVTDLIERIKRINANADVSSEGDVVA